jgi:hypothetical protein
MGVALVKQLLMHLVAVQLKLLRQAALEGRVPGRIEGAPFPLSCATLRTFLPL